MREYQLFFARPDGCVTSVECSAAETDGRVLSEAFDALAQHLGCDRVEVHEGDRFVARVERRPPDPPKWRRGQAARA